MIRQVKLSDTEAIAGIYNEYIQHSTASFETETLTPEEMGMRISAFSSVCPYFVFEEDGRVVGYCYAHPWKERAAYAGTYETTVYIHPAYLHRGIGKALMAKLIESCRQRGFRALIACITAENEASVSLHLGLGFEKVSHFRQVGRKFGRLLDVVDLEYIL